MANQSTNTMPIRYSIETTPGTALTTGWQEIRLTGENINVVTKTMKSAEIVATRQRNATHLVGLSSAGSMQFEWHQGTQMDDFLQLALGGTWTGPNVLQVGPTLKTASVEKKLADISTIHYLLFQYMMVAGLSFEMKVGALIKGAADWMGFAPTNTTTQKSALAPTAINNNALWDLVNYVQVATLNSVAITQWTGFTFKVNNTPRLQPTVGQANPGAIIPGTFELSGTLSLYCNTTNLGTIDSLLAGSLAGPLEVKVGGSSTKSYDFLIPNVLFTGAKGLEAVSLNNDAMVDLTWEAWIDPTNTTMQVTRTP